MVPLGSTAATVDPVSWPSGLDPFVEEIVPVPDLADSSLAYPGLALAWKASYGVVVVAAAAAAVVVVVAAAGAFAAAVGP